MDSANDVSAGQYWPIVKRVKAKGKWDVLQSGAVFVDAPGVNDDNSSRDKVVKGYLKSADSVSCVACCATMCCAASLCSYMTRSTNQLTCLMRVWVTDMDCLQHQPRRERQDCQGYAGPQLPAAAPYGRELRLSRVCSHTERRASAVGGNLQHAAAKDHLAEGLCKGPLRLHGSANSERLSGRPGRDGPRCGKETRLFAPFYT